MTIDGDQQDRSLFVSWRDPEAGSIHPIGRLIRRVAAGSERYSFAYLKGAEALDWFRPLAGLPDLHRRYDSDRLFPVFSNRMMPRSRPEYDVLASRVDLGGEADPFEVLARSGGRRATDRIEVFSPPEETTPGHGTVLFFARGLRHVAGALDQLDELSPGDELRLVDDPSNSYNQLAVTLHATEGAHLGWVPDYLVDHVHHMRELNGDEPTTTVVHVNDHTAPPHQRLLCRMEARWPEGYRPFSGPEFQTLVGLD